MGLDLNVLSIKLMNGKCTACLFRLHFKKKTQPNYDASPQITKNLDNFQRTQKRHNFISLKRTDENETKGTNKLYLV